MMDKAEPTAYIAALGTIEDGTHILVNRIAALEAENGRLKVCGNCGHFTTVPDYVARCDLLDQVDAEIVGGRWPNPSQSCVFPGMGTPNTLSSWAERSAP